MKTLILGPLDYPSIRQDLIFMNYQNNVYSIYYAFEGMYATFAKRGDTLENQTGLMLLLANSMTEKEYESSDIFFGLAPKRYHFDRVIVYNYDTLIAQEALINSHYKCFEEQFYNINDVTDSCINIMEAIKLAQFTAAEGNK
jgi:hypothetical protein